MKIEDMNLTATGKMALNHHIKRYGKSKGSKMFKAAIHSNMDGTQGWTMPNGKKVKLSKYTQVLSGEL